VIDRTDAHIEHILRAAGSSLRHYTPQSKDNLRKAMREVMAEIKAGSIVPYAEEIVSLVDGKRR
jgi:hypothetical protein